MSKRKQYTLAQARTSGIHTLEIAAACVDGLTTALDDSGIFIVADGIANRPSPSGDEPQFPAVRVTVGEGMPKEHNSRRYEFGVEIEPITLYQKDRDQGELYWISRKVRIWLATATLSLNSSTFQALRSLSRPRPEKLDHYQSMEFDIACDALLPADER